MESFRGYSLCLREFATLFTSAQASVQKLAMTVLKRMDVVKNEPTRTLLLEASGLKGHNTPVHNVTPREARLNGVLQRVLVYLQEIAVLYTSAEAAVHKLAQTILKGDGCGGDRPNLRTPCSPKLRG